MDDFERLHIADMQRRAAMIAADQNALKGLLADELTWTHSSGATETKAQFIAAIAKGDVVYEVLEIEQDQVRQIGDVLIHSGMLRGRASRAGLVKALNAKFLSVWRMQDEKMALVAWQSTNSNE